MSISDINTIVIAIMENRSFDHMLGYLSFDGSKQVDGLRQDPLWRAKVANNYLGKNYEPFAIDPREAPCSDPQHDQASIAVQINTRSAGMPSMGGFVESYATLSDPVPTDPSAVMGYFMGSSVPAFDFFARNYCVCDHWFSALPLGTQANRLMAMAGESLLLDNAGAMLPSQDLVYDWLTRHNITWRAYQSGDFLPFFSLMPDWLPEIAASLTLSQIGAGGRFRRLMQLEADWQSTKQMPSVIFIEPEYTDGPHISPNDDHAPTGVEPGQAFLADLYRTLTSNPARWASTLLVVTYDEHGGFFDHVLPLPIATTIDGVTLNTTGVRVPAFIISPYVSPGSVFQGALDHTSILQLLDDKFLTGEGYSGPVNQRQADLDRILNTLATVSHPGGIPHIPGMTAIPAVQATAPTPSAPKTKNAAAFDVAARKMAAEHSQLLEQRGWEKMNAYLATTAPR